jgi:glutathione S-transferase
MQSTFEREGRIEPRTMKLFYSPGACSLAVHIVARELGLDVQLVRMDGKTHTLLEGGADYYAINPKGSVPAITLPDGGVLTEAAVIVQYLADQKPEAGLAPKLGTMERYRLMELLNFCATDLHKQLNPLFNPKLNDEARGMIKDRFLSRLAVVDKQLEGKQYLLGNSLTVVDPYVYTVFSWVKRFDIDLAKWPNIDGFMKRMAERPAVKAARAAEGLPA